MDEKTTNKIGELESRVTHLEDAYQELRNQVFLLLNAHGENQPIPTGANPLKSQCHAGKHE